MIDTLEAMGFGYVEIGAVTPREQHNNTSPAIYKFKDDHALLNSADIDSDGVERVIENVKRRNSKIIVGCNIAKNSDTDPENAPRDYLRLFRPLYQYVDYFTVNICLNSTDKPYTPSDREEVMAILQPLFEFRRGQNQYRPLLLKISPDWSNSQIDDMVAILIDTPLDGLVVSDCSTRFHSTLTPKEAERLEGCALSGAPLLERTIELIRYVCSKMDYSYPVIGVGGMMCAEDAQRMLDAGASLVQCYSALTYEGPAFVGRTCRQLATPAREAEKEARKNKNTKK
jgi:dihydroorotate dehydrogenase